MDQTEYQNQQNLTRLINIQFLKKITQLLVSVSVFSFFFSYPSFLSLLQSLNLYFSTFPFHLFSHTLDKNCIFLLCNGLLVFLAKYSGLIRSPSGSNHSDESFKSIGDGLHQESLMLDTNEVMVDKEVLVESIRSAENVAVEQGTEIDHFIKEVQKEAEKSVVEKGGGRESRLSISKEEEEDTGVFVLVDEEEEKEFLSGSFIEERVEEEDEEGNGMLSTEELNKKFDDFIRRIKEEIRIGAQQQLVLV